MNTEHSEWILAYLDGTISDEGMARLNAVLLESAEARAQLRSWAAADVRLRELAADAAGAAPVGPRAHQPRAGTTVSWLDRGWLRGWRAPIAAGLAIGAAFTSVVWAYVAPPAASSRSATSPPIRPSRPMSPRAFPTSRPACPPRSASNGPRCSPPAAPSRRPAPSIRVAGGRSETPRMFARLAAMWVSLTG